ncbi:MAG: hypothetical protein DRH33_02100 [Candidatus Nealsonbacteria bacterium]|nr:MAG: hypothetical protein DRH33_02100 [Candidatus Nealsonbacteria bacterium]
MRKVKVLRKKYPKFFYKNYKIELKKNDLEISFDFEIPPKLSFQPKIKIKNVARSRLKEIKNEILENLAFHLGLIEMLSYWKATCSGVIEIEAGSLKKEQIKWWKDLIIKGMGQYFFENRIDWREAGFLRIVSSSSKKFKRIKQKVNKGKFLIAMGEGKDSITTLELLKKKGLKVNCFVVNPNKIHFKILKEAGIGTPIIVERKIDPKLFQLNQKGFLNGHTPITALHSFLGVLCGILFDFGNVVFSNERSSNEGNLKYLGKTINHQYSKSFEFEEKFRDYLKKYITPEINYFSFLRPLYEIQIAKIFSGFKQYLPLFLSCNEAKKTYSGKRKPAFKWCDNCPKCLFTFALLYPFLSEKELVNIFRENLFQKKELLPLMLQLIGEKKFKPLECVGTKKENLAAFYLSWEKAKRIGKTPYLLKYFGKTIFPKYPNLKQVSKNIMNSWDKNHNLSRNLLNILKSALNF